MTMPEFAAAKPNTFAFSVRRLDMQKAYEIAKLSGELVLIQVRLAADHVAFITEKRGIRCESSFPIKWDSMPWRGSPLQFETQRSLFQSVLLTLMSWETIQIRGDYPPAVDEPDASNETIWTITAGDTRIKWPFTLVSAERPDLSGATGGSVNPKAISGALRLLKGFPEAEQKQPAHSTVSAGGTRAIASSPGAVRIVHDERLPEPPFAYKGTHVSDLAQALQAFDKETQIYEVGTSLVFDDGCSRCTVDRALASFDVSRVERESPLVQISIRTFELNSGLSKILSQTRPRDKNSTIRWLFDSNSNTLRLSTRVNGGDASVLLRCSINADNQPPRSFAELIFKADDFKKLIAVPRVEETNLFIFSNYIMARQSSDGARVDTYIAARTP